MSSICLYDRDTEIKKGMHTISSKAPQFSATGDLSCQFLLTGHPVEPGYIRPIVGTAEHPSMFFNAPAEVLYSSTTAVRREPNTIAMVELVEAG